MVGERARILIALHSNSPSAILIESLTREADLDLTVANDGFEALRMALRVRPDLVVLDMALPGFGSVNLCRILKLDSLASQPAILLLTNTGEAQDVKIGANSWVDKVMFEPVDREALLRELRTMVPIKRQADQPTLDSAVISMRNTLPDSSTISKGSHNNLNSTQALKDAHFQPSCLSVDLRKTQVDLQANCVGMIKALAAAVDARDRYTNRHSERVASYALIIARSWGLHPEDREPLLYGALLHDLGKIGVPDAVLYKSEPLTAEEWEIIKRHPESGYRMLLNVPFLASALPAILYHHERYDGTGYPRGLQGDEIPYLARLIAVADGLDAMTSHRSYRTRLPFSFAKRAILAAKGSQYCPNVVDAFAMVFDELQSWAKRNHEHRFTIEPSTIGVRLKRQSR